MQLEIVINGQQFFQAELFKTNAKSLQLRPHPESTIETVECWFLALFSYEHDAVEFSFTEIAEMCWIVQPSLVMIDLQTFRFDHLRCKNDLPQTVK